MLYFAYGSNLHQKQMKRRCKNSKYIGCYTLKNFKLSFRNYYLGGGVADIEKKLNSNPEFFNILALGEKLHMSVRDILQMPVSEFNMWIAYFELQREKQEQAERLQKR